MMRSMPALSVTVDAGQLTHAPVSSTVTTPAVSSTSISSMSPPSAWMAGRTTSITSATWSRTGGLLQNCSLQGMQRAPCGEIPGLWPSVDGFDVGSECDQALIHALVAPVDVLGVVDGGRALGGERGDHQ